jgi:hypothetical protein
MGARDLADRLGREAEAVCRHYLPKGYRSGGYWRIGDAYGTPGRSTFIRLHSTPDGRRAGRWQDAATGEYGDLLDIIRLALPSGTFADAVAEAKRFVGGESDWIAYDTPIARPRRRDPVIAAKRLFGQGTSIEHTLAADYLRGRGIDPLVATGLRFSPDCYCHPTTESQVRRWPALIAPVTDANTNLTGVHRLYLNPLGAIAGDYGKAPVLDPKRSLGRIQGNAVRFGRESAVLVVAEGIENALSVRMAFPHLTVHACLTAGNLADYRPPVVSQIVLIALDDDVAGQNAADRLSDRVRTLGIEAIALRPLAEDHNLDLLALGLEQFRDRLRCQLPEDLRA